MMFPSDPEYTRRLDAWNQAGSSPSLLVRDSSHPRKNGAALPRQPLINRLRPRGPFPFASC